MSGASETHHTTGNHVAVGDHTTMHVTYHGGLPPVPPGTPAGTRVVVRYEMIIGDASGAAAPTSEGEEQQQPQQQQQQSQPQQQPPPHQQQQPPQQQQQQPSQQQQQQQPPQHQQQRRPPLQPQQRPQQSTGGRSQNLSQPSSEQLQQRPSQRAQQQQSLQVHQQQAGQGAQHMHQSQQRNHTQPRSVHQPRTSGHSVRQPQQETSHPGQHPSSRQRLPQQQPDSSNGQDQLQAHRQGQQQAQGEQGNVHPSTDGWQVPKQTVEPSTGLPYSMSPISDFPAMRQEPQVTSGISDLTIVENGQANRRHRPTFQRSSTDPSSDQNTRPKTVVSSTRSLPISTVSTCSDQTSVKAIPYSLNPKDCPNEVYTEGSIKQLTVMPKSESCSSKPSAIDTKISEDAHPPELTDIIAFKITSNPVVIVSDMANSRIKIVKSIQGVPSQVECITLPSSPIALSHFKGDNILVSYCHVMQFSFVNITKRIIEQTFETKRQYSSLAVIRETTLAACCRQFQSVDILDLKGNTLKSYSMAQSKSPCYVSVASEIFVTDWMANTLTCLDNQVKTKFIVSPSGRAVLRGLVQSGSDVLVADDDGDRILCFEASGRSVKVFLDKKNGICKPRGLCIHSNTLYIAEESGLIRTWKMPEVANTRL